LNVTNNRRSAVDANPQLRPHSILRFKIVSRFQPLKDRQGGSTRSQRRVFMRDGRAKDRHDSVAGKALHAPALLTYGILREPREALHECKSCFFAFPLREGREANHVCE
jgi:hypothetical protein